MLSHRLKKRICIGIGAKYSELTKIYRSKNEAYEVLLSANINQGIVDISDDYALRVMAYYNPKKEKEAILDQFRRGQLQNISVNLSTLAEAVRHNTVVHLDAPYPTSIRRTIIELLVEIIHIASDAGVSIDEELGNVDPYQKVFELHNTPEIIRWSTDVIVRLSLAVENRRNRIENQLLEKARTYIHEHLADMELGLATVSREVGMSPTYFSAFFIREMNMGFKEYVNEKRIELAKYHLINSKDSVNRIAECCGFLSPSYFITVFKTQTGMTPGAYRKMKN